MKTPGIFAAKIIITLLLYAFLICSDCYSFQNEPDGFEGMKWGEDIKIMKKRFIQKEVQGGFFAGDKDMCVYVKINDNKMLGPVNLKDIYYYFWKDKFICVEIITMGLSNFASIKRLCFERYGSNIEESDKMNKNIDIYTWKGDLAGISLFHYDDSKGFEQGLLRIYSQKMTKQIAGDKVKQY